MDQNDLNIQRNNQNGMVVRLNRERDRQQELMNRIIRQPCEKKRSYKHRSKTNENTVKENRQQVTKNIETIDYLRGITNLERGFTELADSVVSTTLKLSHECNTLDRETLSPKHFSNEVTTAWQQISELGHTVQTHVRHAKRYHLFYLDIDHLEGKIRNTVNQIDARILELRSKKVNQTTLRDTKSAINQTVKKLVELFREWQKLESKAKVVAPLHFRMPLPQGQHSGTLMKTVTLDDGARFPSGSRVSVSASRPGDYLLREWIIEDDVKKLVTTVPAPLVWLNSPDSTPNALHRHSPNNFEIQRRSHTISPSSFNNRRAVQMIKEDLFAAWDTAGAKFRDLVRAQSEHLLNHSLEKPTKRVKDGDKADTAAVLQKITEFLNLTETQEDADRSLEAAVEAMNLHSQEGTDQQPVIDVDLGEALIENIDAYSNFQMRNRRHATEENLKNAFEDTDALISEHKQEVEMMGNSLTRQYQSRELWKPFHLSRHQTSFEGIKTNQDSPVNQMPSSSMKIHRSKKHSRDRRWISLPRPNMEESNTQFSSYPRSPDREIVATVSQPVQASMPDFQQSIISTPHKRAVSLDLTPQVAGASGDHTKDKKKKVKRRGFQNPFRRRHSKVIMQVVNNNELSQAFPPPEEQREQIGDREIWIQQGTPTGLVPPDDALILSSPKETTSTLGRFCRKQRRHTLQPQSTHLDSGVYTEAESGLTTMTSQEIKPTQQMFQEELAPLSALDQHAARPLYRSNSVDHYTVACQVGEFNLEKKTVAMLSTACQHGVCQESRSVETEKLLSMSVQENKSSVSGKKLQVGKPWSACDEDGNGLLAVETIDSTAQTVPLPSHEYDNLTVTGPATFDMGVQTLEEEPVIAIQKHASLVSSAPSLAMPNEIEEICIDSSDSETRPRKRSGLVQKHRKLVFQTSRAQFFDASCQADSMSQQPLRAKLTGISCELQFREPGAMVGDNLDPRGCKYPATMDRVENQNLCFHIDFEDELKRNRRRNSSSSASY